MIQVEDLTKRYGDVNAVDHLSFRVESGKVTGFLGANGAGKSTTMRMILGLDAPTSGTATIDGRSYAALPTPLASVGALLDAGGVDPRRRAVDHLLWMAASNGIDRRRVDLVLGLVGLERAAARPAGTFSLGMKQRLGLAAALLGDPATLVLDEPINGLDPDGIIWIRGLLRSLAAEGRTVFVSSHLMAEMAQTAEHLVVIDRGRLVADAPADELLAANAGADVLVRAVDAQPGLGTSPGLDGRPGLGARPGVAQPGVAPLGFDRRSGLDALLVAAGAWTSPGPDGALVVVGLDASAIGRIANDHGIALAELTPRRASLEAAFLQLTHDHEGAPR